MSLAAIKNMNIKEFITHITTFESVDVYWILVLINLIKDLYMNAYGMCVLNLDFVIIFQNLILHIWLVM